MARDGSGTYSLPAGSIIANGDTSDATDLNTPLQDIETDLNTARPIVAGGTGATTAAAARANILGSSYSLGDMTFLTSGTAATYTTPSGARALRVTVVGAGGGGGGADGQGAGTCACAGGGGAGAVVSEFITSPAASYTYTIGAGGAGGTAAGPGDGASGGNTTFADGASLTLTANGGSGGAGATGGSGAVVGSRGLGGTGSGGDLNTRGQSGETGLVVSGDPASVGTGGSGRFGSAQAVVPSASNVAGSNASGYGAGGTGALAWDDANNAAGGDGSGGLIIIEVFY